MTRIPDRSSVGFQSGAQKRRILRSFSMSPLITSTHPWPAKSPGAALWFRNPVAMTCRIHGSGVSFLATVPELPFVQRMSARPSASTSSAATESHAFISGTLATRCHRPDGMRFHTVAGQPVSR